MGAEGLVPSLLCTFGSWYNSSGQAQRHHQMASRSNSSQSVMELFAREWRVFLPPRQQTGALQVCPVLGFLAVVLVVPPILTKVFSSPLLRQETRYLLLGNTLLSDLLFMFIYLLSTCFNAAGVATSEWSCATLLFLLGIFYSAGLLSAMAMVLDTSLAVLAPLRYLALWPVSRTRWAIAAVWAASVVFPAGTVAGFLWHHSADPCASQVCSLPVLLALTVGYSVPMRASMLLTVAGVLLVLLLVLFGYVFLCCRTRRSGVWRGERASRARGTFFIHYFHLLLSICPMLVLAVELLLYARPSRSVELRAHLLASLVLCNVLLVLPKALAPYLYGLRYRDLDLCRTLLTFYRLKRPATVTPLTKS
ncbi:probable G-protein coupled receptor 148 [Anguilla rostrata]|uniref:probable G-protein coupled receptor 148 n=1 Tax=Anguilla rostrata TaxID=7938 RepID=UPI0030CB6144